jgi:hypothetical protein
LFCFVFTLCLKQEEGFMVAPFALIVEEKEGPAERDQAKDQNVVEWDVVAWMDTWRNELSWPMLYMSGGAKLSGDC